MNSTSCGSSSVAQVARIAVARERAFATAAEEEPAQAARRGHRPGAESGSIDAAGRSDDARVVVDLVQPREEVGLDRHVVVQEDDDVAGGVVDAEVALAGQAGRGPEVADRGRECWSKAVTTG